MISRIITIDQSTSATKAMLFSEDCELLHRVNIEHQQFYPQIGWVEHDAEEIYKNTIEAIHCLLEQEEVNGKDISYSLAITNQRETVVVWNRHTGKSVYHAVVWQCQRGAAICKELKDKGYSELVEGGNLAASKIRNLECPSYEICLIDYGCGKFNRKIHIMEQYP